MAGAPVGTAGGGTAARSTIVSSGSASMRATEPDREIPAELFAVAPMRPPASIRWKIRCGSGPARPESWTVSPGVRRSICCATGAAPTIDCAAFVAVESLAHRKTRCADKSVALRSVGITLRDDLAAPSNGAAEPVERVVPASGPTERGDIVAMSLDASSAMVSGAVTAGATSASDRAACATLGAPPAEGCLRAGSGSTARDAGLRGSNGTSEGGAPRS